MAMVMDNVIGLKLYMHVIDVMAMVIEVGWTLLAVVGLKL